ncbi:MAG: hypothetical protein J5636_08655 [Clostridiales bacterium]|nr:hypothetical protein [Clostridiales bacterium]
MKHEPVRKPITPGYPTLEQIRDAQKNNKAAKVAVVTAITASLALAAGCGDDISPIKALKKLGKQRKAKITTTEWVLAGDTETTPEPTDTEYILEGEAPYETDDFYVDGEEDVGTDATDYYIDGDVQIDPDYTESTVIEGGLEIVDDGQ